MDVSAVTRFERLLTLANRSKHCWCIAQVQPWKPSQRLPPNNERENVAAFDRCWLLLNAD
jgi:hypothetical protein